MKVYAMFSIISLVFMLGCIYLDQEKIFSEYFNLDNEFCFRLKIALSLNYCFWSLMFFVECVKDIIRIFKEIKNIKK